MILLDSSFLLARFNDRDEHHQKAMKVLGEVDRGMFGRALVTDYIFNEVVTVSLIKIKELPTVVRLGKILLESFRLIRIEEEAFADAWEIFRSQGGSRLGFTDCTSVAAMRMHDIGNIATFDRDFLKIGGISCVGV